MLNIGIVLFYFRAISMMSRVEYSDTNIVIPILAYRYPVFFMTLLAVDDMRSVSLVKAQLLHWSMT